MFAAPLMVTPAGPFIVHWVELSQTLHTFQRQIKQEQRNPDKSGVILRTVKTEERV